MNRLIHLPLLSLLFTLPLYLAAAQTPANSAADAPLEAALARVAGVAEQPAPSPVLMAPQDQKIENQIAATLATAKGADKEQAKVLLRNLIAANPNAPATAHAMYEYALLFDEVPAIFQNLQALLQKFPASAYATEGCRRIGEYAALNNRFDLALKADQAYLLRRPSATDARKAQFDVADCLRQLGRYNDAIAAYQQLIDEAPADPDSAPRAQDSMATCLMAMRRYDEAIRQIEALMTGFKTYRNLPVVLLNEGLCLEETGRPQDAILRYQDLRRFFPKTNEADLAGQRLADLQRPLLGPTGQSNQIITPAPLKQAPAMTNHFETGGAAPAPQGAVGPASPQGAIGGSAGGAVPAPPAFSH